MNNKYIPTIEDITAMSGIDTLPPGKLDITRRMAQLSDIKKGKKVLVTCSHRGYQSVIYAKECGAEVCGLDIDERMIEFARENSEKEKISINFVKGDAQEIPFGSEQFDIVTNEGAVGIPESPQKVLSEMVRVLKKDGILIFRESIFADNLSDEEKEELRLRYGNNIEDIKGWKERVDKAGAEVVFIETEQWSEPSNFWNVRHDREVQDYHDLYTMTEKLRLSKILMKKYGKDGISMAAENERIFYDAVKNKKIGYGIFLCKKINL